MSLGTTLSFSQVRAAREVGRLELTPALRLAPRHIKVAALMADGLRNKDIAQHLGITEGAVKVYVSEVYAITGLDSRLKITQWVKSRESVEYGQALDAAKLLAALQVTALEVPAA